MTILGFCLNQSETRTGAHSSLLDVIVGRILHTVVQILQIYQAQEKSHRHHKVAKHLQLIKLLFESRIIPKQFLIGALISVLFLSTVSIWFLGFTTDCSLFPGLDF